MKKFLLVVLVLCISTNLTYADRTYTYIRSVGQDPDRYDFTTINDAIVDIMQCNLASENLGCIQVYKGVYIEQLNSFYPGGHNLPVHCDLIGMEQFPDDVVIQHQRRSTSDPNFTDIVSEIYADGVLCDGDNIVSNLKVHNVGQNQNSVEFIGEGTLENCIIVSKHNALTGRKHLIVSGCDIEGKYLPCVQPYSTFEIYDCNLYPKTRPWGGEHPAGIKAWHSGTIDNVTIEADVASSDYEPHYDTPWLAGVILQLRNSADTVTITNVRMNLKLTTLYHDDRPEETADWELFGVVSGGRNPKPTTYYPGRGIVKDCQINLTGIEDSSNPNGDGRAIMVAGVCVQGGGRVDVIGNTSIKTSRTPASFGKEGYEYSLNNQNGILTVDFNTVDFDETITNGLITAYDPNEFAEPKEPNEPNEPNNPSDPNYPEPVSTYWQEQEDKRAQNLKNCPMVAAKDAPSGKDPARGLTNPYSKTGRIAPLGSPVEIPPDTVINSNTIWDSDVHLNGKVYVENALLVIMPGVIVWNAAEGGIIVRNGGVIHAKGVPGNRIVFISDAQASWTDYDFAIKIKETASPACKIGYCDIVYATKGIWILNNRLDFPIEDNEVWDCNDGIVEEGPMLTDILNNQIIGSWDDGIEVSLADSNGVATSDAEIFIENNLINGEQYCGITVWGVADANDAGKVVMANNLIVGSYWYAVCQVGDWMEAYRICNGYYANYAIENPENPFDDIDPVILTEDPFVYGRYTYPFFIEQDCELVDAGYQYIEQTHLVGKTTDVDGLPDYNVADIGFHYCHWDYTNTGEGDFLAGDLNHDWHTDFKDFAILANGWQMTYDINDLAALAGTWLQYGGPTPNIVPSFDQDPNNVSGGLTMTISVPDPNIHRVFVMLDGERYGEFGDLFESSILTMETEPYLNGTHSIKIIYLYDDVVICSQTVQVTFNNDISVFRGSDSFTPGEDYYLYGLGNGTYRVQVEDIVNENIVYSQTFTDGLEVHIDANSFPEEYGLYELDVDQQTLSLEITWKDIVEKIIGRKFKKEDFPQNCPIKMVVSIGSKDLVKAKSACWKAVIRAAVKKKIWPVFLTYNACTWENLSYCLSLDNVKMWYHVSHGNYKLLGQPPRQCIKTASGWVFSYLKKDFDPNNIPPNYRKLWWFYEDNHSIAELGLKGSDKMIWVQFNACYSAHTIEFPKMLGIWPIKDPLMIGEQLFVGWKGPALVSDILGKYNQFEEDYWDYLRQGYTLKDAVDYALPPAGGTRILENFMYYGVVDWQYARFRYPDIN